MSKKTQNELDRAFWLKMKQRMALSELDTKVTRERAKRVYTVLPPRNESDTVGERIRRTRNTVDLAVQASTVNPFATPRSLQYLAQIVRLAADTDDDQFPLPDPGWVYESDDGRWRLQIASGGRYIRLIFQALGFAVDEFSNCSIVFWDDVSDKPFAVVKLDNDGDGACDLPNTQTVRKALCQPYVLVECA